MSAVIIAAPAPIFVDQGQGTPGAPSPTGGVMTVQGQTGSYPVSVVAGITGPVGVTGYVGVTGLNAVGITGPVALKGAVGITGPVGVTGYVGITGLNAVGITGPVALKGAVGITGPVGVTGYVGVTGLNAVGITGAVAPLGAVGITGPVSVQGFGNPTGPTGGILSIQGVGTAGVPTGGVLSIQTPDSLNDGSLNAANANVQVPLSGHSSIGFQLSAGTLIGTIVPEVSFDGGTTWVTTFFDDPTTDNKVSSIVFTSNNTATSRTIVGAGGASHARVRVSAFTSGTASCSLRSSLIYDNSVLFAGQSGITGALPPSVAQVGGSDGSTLRALLTDTTGRVVIAPASASATTAGFVTGDVVLTNTGNVVVRRTTLTEQTSNAQRSIVSSSANDTSAGTGARQVKITYYTSAGVGPNTEVVAMNGTTAVNTVSTTICYVEKIEVISVGSTGSNVGSITLKAATAGTGATIMTMNATDNTVYLGLHYVPSGKTCYITGISIGSNSSGISQGGVFTLRAQDLSSTTSPDKQVSDALYLFGQSSEITRNYGTPIQVVGPARIQLWVNPFSSNTVTFSGGFDFYEQ